LHDARPSTTKPALRRRVFPPSAGLTFPRLKRRGTHASRSDNPAQRVRSQQSPLITAARAPFSYIGDAPDRTPLSRPRQARVASPRAATASSPLGRRRPTNYYIAPPPATASARPAPLPGTSPRATSLDRLKTTAARVARPPS